VSDFLPIIKNNVKIIRAVKEMSIEKACCSKNEVCISAITSKKYAATKIVPILKP
jgi:hypothetical protein